jgi:hypothetical protein
VALKKPSEVIKNNLVEDYNPLSASIGQKLQGENTDVFSSFTSFKKNLEKIDVLTESIEEFRDELSEKASKSDLENGILSQILVIDENFTQIKNQLNGINRRDLNEFKRITSDINEVVSNLITNDIPQYKKIITNVEVSLTDNFERLQENFLNLQGAVNEISHVEENLLENFDNLEKKFENFSDEIHGTIELVNENIEEKKKELEYKISDVKSDLLISEKQFYKKTEEISSEIDVIKNDIDLNEERIYRVDEYLQQHHLRVINLREEVLSELRKIPVGDFDNNIRQLEKKINRIEELYSSINPDEVVSGVIKEGLTSIDPNTKNSDPLTPLDQSFVTKQELESHYRLFLNRIQQQLSTVGGGGETQLKYLDDIVGIATNAAAYDGKVLSYNHSLRKFEFITGGGGGNAAITISDTPPPNPSDGNLWYDSTIGRTFIYYNDGNSSQWVDASPSGGIPQNITNSWIPTSVGIHTLSNVGIGTTNPVSKLTVQGTALVTGVSTFNSDVNVGINTSIGVVLTSPNGTKFRLIVDNGGSLSTVIVP